jgi:Flp pilus assembly protein TadB
MLIWLMVAAGWAVGVPPLIVAAGALMAVNLPIGLAAVGTAGFIVHRRRRQGDEVDEAEFLRAIATSVSAGSTLRTAIRSGDRTVVSPRTRRLCDAGVSMARVGRSLEPVLVHNGAAFAAVCSLSETTGSLLAPTLHVLADRSADVADLTRHRGVATAQARFSAVIVGVAPLAATAGLIVLRGVPGDGNPVAVAAVVLGSAMQVAGIVVVFVLASRSVS